MLEPVSRYTTIPVAIEVDVSYFLLRISKPASDLVGPFLVDVSFELLLVS